VPSIRRLTPYLLLTVLVLGTGLGIGLGLSEAPSQSVVMSLPRSTEGTTPAILPLPTTTTTVPPLAALTVAVPNVVGEAPSQAGATLSAAGLQASFIPGSVSQKIPLGYVVIESPPGGGRTSEGSTVILTQSWGPPLPPPTTNYAPTPTSSLATALCQPSELAAVSLGNDHGGRVDSLPFWIADVGVSPCSVPAVASVVLLTSTGDVFGVYRPDGSLSVGYFELHLQTANRIEIVTAISNWCGTPTPPTSAAITMAGVGTLEVPISVGNGQGIACANALFPPGVVSPVQVVLVSG
jgi:hypothetical protein